MVGVPGSCSALWISNLQGVAETSSVYAAGQQYHPEALPLLEGKIYKDNILLIIFIVTILLFLEQFELTMTFDLEDMQFNLNTSRYDLEINHV